MASTKLFSSSCCSSKRTSVNAVLSLPKLPRVRLSVPASEPVIRELKMADNINRSLYPTTHKQSSNSSVTAKLYLLLEAVSDRIEMHKNIGEQRENWNTLLLNSINMMTLTATMIAGFASTIGGTESGRLSLKLCSALLFSGATGMLIIINKLQPSQLVEEQRNASRLFKQLQNQIQTAIVLDRKEDVRILMGKVLALDKAYPLPLLGAMLEKFPKSFQPAVWWPTDQHTQPSRNGILTERVELEYSNGWSQELEIEMREIVRVLKTKDQTEYNRLGNIVLKVNKVLAISGPLLTGIAALATPFIGHGGSWAPLVAVVAGSLATAVNTMEHGGQVGMVFEMYRNSAGFFKLLQESIESTLNESEALKRENGEVFEMKVALKLGRSLSQLRDLANDEFGSKLF
jgi:hypothetical protein